MEIRGKNEHDHLILKYDKKLRCFVDVTRDVIYLKQDFGSYYIVFAKNESEPKGYHCKISDVKWCINPEKINIDDYNIVLDNHYTTKVVKILKFSNLGYKVFLSNNHTFFLNNLDIKGDQIIISSINFENIKGTGNRILDYYFALSKYASDISNDPSSIDSLQYKLYLSNPSVNRDCVLSYYTNEHLSFVKGINKYIFPFATNNSQIKAIRNTFKNPLSIISGPPGTGKTQVILNIICNAVLNKKSIAVISNNNTAVQNVYDKLKAEDLDFILAFLGNTDNVDKFFSTTDDFEKRIKKICKHGYLDTNIYLNILEELYSKQNELKILEHDLYEIKKEYELYVDSHVIADYSNLFKSKLSFEKYVELKLYLLSKKKLNKYIKFKLKHRYKIINFDFDLNHMILFIESKYYEERIEDIESRIKIIKDFIQEHNIDEYNNNLKEQSRICLNNYLIDKYNSLDNIVFTKYNYRGLFKEFINRYPVILSTTYSLLRNIEYGYKFDLIVIDEASQSDILSTILTMNIAKQMVIIGDEKQLSQIDNINIYNASDELLHYIHIDDAYKYKENSILHSVLKAPISVPNTILREHYRCEGRIIEYCNRKFYNNELIICSDISRDDSMTIIRTVEGNHARKNPNGSGFYNDREASEIVNLLKTINSKNVGIITPFRAQADYISNLIKDDFPFVEVDTIHKYQGRQKEVIILSTVVNDLSPLDTKFITDFVTDERLLNVAISRAIQKLYLVVSDKVYSSNQNNISEFIEYIKYYSNSNFKGSIKSIFDNLYKSEIECFNKSPLSKYVDSVAETLMINLINNVLKDYPSYSFHLHHRLSDLISDYDTFNKEEVRYIKHPKTHVDFLIYNRINNKPILCIEVDGTKYHDYAKKQIEHDKIKNRILEHNNIRLLRLKTNGNNEEDKLRYMLKE